MNKFKVQNDIKKLCSTEIEFLAVRKWVVMMLISSDPKSWNVQNQISWILGSKLQSFVTAKLVFEWRRLIANERRFLSRNSSSFFEFDWNESAYSENNIIIANKLIHYKFSFSHFLWHSSISANSLVHTVSRPGKAQATCWTLLNSVIIAVKMFIQEKLVHWKRDDCKQR